MDVSPENEISIWLSKLATPGTWITKQNLYLNACYFTKIFYGFRVAGDDLPANENPSLKHC